MQVGWKLPEIYQTQEFLLAKGAGQRSMLCFLWCVAQRDDLVSFPLEIMEMIWNIVSQTVWDDWCYAKVYCESFCFEWKRWEQEPVKDFLVDISPHKLLLLQRRNNRQDFSKTFPPAA